MIRGKEIEKQVFDPNHIQQVLAEIEVNFPEYFRTFAHSPLKELIVHYIEEHTKEQEKYQKYLDLRGLDEFERNPNSFKSYTRGSCPIIRRCLQARDETMKQYKKSFNLITGRQLLDGVRKIAEFGGAYNAGFKDEIHEAATEPAHLGLDTLNENEYGCPGVIGYGVQSSLLYGLFPHAFAHRSQNAVWSLYFLSGRKNFDLQDYSEFLMVHKDQGTCEQNYFYPAQLFGFYALKVFLLLRSRYQEIGVSLHNHNRYIYLGAFCDHVADRHRDAISTYKRNSEHVESYWS
jgi:hypothetical protein